FPFDVAFPAAGGYTLQLSPFPLVAQPVGPYLTADLGTDLSFAVSAAEGSFPSAAPRETLAPATEDPKDMPAPTFALAAAALALAAWAGRRR
ncbi:MAG TPA: hypothetical protein VI796_06095, partial [Candidatus Thermoplasmatota archaeon]|nr:hypothetical protein [Candidatus Thermoplasmatota archaeon]